MRAFAWMAGLVGIAALGRLLAKRSATPPVAAPEPVSEGAEDPAAELRQRLAAQRTPEPVVSEQVAAPEGETLEERRARIHAKAQQAIDAMREPGT